MTSGGQTQDPTQVLWFKFHKVFLLSLTLCFMVFKLLSHTLILLIISNNPVKKIWAPFYGCENWVTGRVSKNWTARSFSLVSNLGPRQKKKKKAFSLKYLIADSLMRILARSIPEYSEHSRYPLTNINIAIFVSKRKQAQEKEESVGGTRRAWRSDF